MDVELLLVHSVKEGKKVGNNPLNEQRTFKKCGMKMSGYGQAG